jgi:hypothetical protein
MDEPGDEGADSVGRSRHRDDQERAPGPDSYTASHGAGHHEPAEYPAGIGTGHQRDYRACRRRGDYDEYA